MPESRMATPTPLPVKPLDVQQAEQPLGPLPHRLRGRHLIGDRDAGAYRQIPGDVNQR